MAHFAKVKDGVVISVIVAEEDFFDTFIDATPGKWIQTSYNTKGGVHLLGNTPLRKNFAGVGYIYDKLRDAFYAPQPFPSWSLNEDSCIWEPPVARPTDDNGPYNWNEETQSWEVTTD
jgi:hypothetical protein